MFQGIHACTIETAKYHRNLLDILGKAFYNIFMEVSFDTKRLARILNSEKEIIREFGLKLGKSIMRRLAVLEAANCLEDVPITPPFRRHELKHNRKGQFAVDLEQPYRLIFEPNHNPVPVKEDGGLDLKKITAITILEVEDYH